LLALLYYLLGQTSRGTLPRKKHFAPLVNLFFDLLRKGKAKKTADRETVGCIFCLARSDGTDDVMRMIKD